MPPLEPCAVFFFLPAFASHYSSVASLLSSAFLLAFFAFLLMNCHSFVFHLLVCFYHQISMNANSLRQSVGQIRGVLTTPVAITARARTVIDSTGSPTAAKVQSSSIYKSPKGNKRVVLHSGQTYNGCALTAIIFQRKIKKNVESFTLTAKLDAVSENVSFFTLCVLS